MEKGTTTRNLPPTTATKTATVRAKTQNANRWSTKVQCDTMGGIHPNGHAGVGDYKKGHEYLHSNHGRTKGNGNGWCIRPVGVTVNSFSFSAETACCGANKPGSVNCDVLLWVRWGLSGWLFTLITDDADDDNNELITSITDDDYRCWRWCRGQSWWWCFFQSQRCSSW